MSESRKFAVSWCADPAKICGADMDWVVAHHACAAATTAYIAWAKSCPMEAAAVGELTVSVREDGSRQWRKIRVTPEIVATATEVRDA